MMKANIRDLHVVRLKKKSSAKLVNDIYLKAVDMDLSYSDKRERISKRLRGKGLDF